MSVKLRLRRLGRKKVPIFSIVATDSRNARDGRYIEDLGRYYPLRDPVEVKIERDRVLYWLGNGANPSDTVRSILRKRGLMLQHAMRQRGASEAEIQTAVEEHLERVAERGEEIQVADEVREEQALEREKARARALEQEAVPLDPDADESDEEASDEEPSDEEASDEEASEEDESGDEDAGDDEPVAEADADEADADEADSDDADSDEDKE